MTRFVPLALLAALLVLVPGATVRGEKAPGGRALPVEVVERHMAEVTRIRGESFAKRPPVVRVTPQAYLDRMLGDIERLLGGDATLKQFEILMRDLGQIGPRGSVMGIAKRFIPASAAASYDARLDRIEMLRGFRSSALLCHELTHALDDQRFDLLRMFADGPLEFDRLLALGALVEGSAESVEMTYRTKGAFPLLPISILKSQGEQRAEAYMARHRDVPRLLARAFIFQYLSGLVFVQTVMRHRLQGWSALDEAFRNPPRTTEQILHPEKYFAREGPLPLTPFRPAGWRVKAENVLGELGTIIALEGFGTRLATAKAAARGWGADRIAHLEAKDGAGIFVWDTVWDSEREAREFFAIARSGLRGTKRRAGTGMAVGIRADRTVDLLLARKQRVTLLRGVPAGELARLRLALLATISR